MTVQTFPAGVDLAGGGRDRAGSLLKHRNVDIKSNCVHLFYNINTILYYSTVCFYFADKFLEKS